MIAVASNLRKTDFDAGKIQFERMNLQKIATASQAGRCPTHERAQCKARFLFIKLRRFSQFGSYSSCPVKATLQKNTRVQVSHVVK